MHSSSRLDNQRYKLEFISTWKIAVAADLLFVRCFSCAKRHQSLVSGEGNIAYRTSHLEIRKKLLPVARQVEDG